MLSPAIITLPWRPDAAEHYFAPLSAQPWAMLLHSGFADHPHNRFDILVAAPRATLLTRGEQTWVDDGETAFVSAEDPLQLLQQQLDRQPFTPQPHDDLPFLGGALGLFGYDLGRRFERLPAHAQADIALPDMAVGIYDWALIVDHQRQQISLLSYDNPAVAAGAIPSGDETFRPDLCLAVKYEPPAVRREISPGAGLSAQRRLLSGQPRPAFSGPLRR